MKAVGIDIGTTTISACVIDVKAKKTVKTKTINHGFIKDAKPYEKIQDVKEIEETFDSIISEITDEFSDINCLGFTGQMHGIVYLDKDLKPVSPLITWQDERGNETYPGEDISFAQKLTQITGYKCATGYGAVTHFYNQIMGLIPDNAKCFTTIHDYLFMRLCGIKECVTHSSDGASLGLFDLKSLSFDKEAIKESGMDFSFFPMVCDDLCKHTDFGFMASIPIGDNQACFNGAVKDPNTQFLINIGTGGQVSVRVPALPNSDKIDARPYVNSDYILSGSALCGGRSYAVLEAFFRKLLTAAGCGDEPAYALMEKLLDEADGSLKVNTLFCGTRDNPELRGSITDIGTDNFTPANLTVGFMKGLVDEIKELYGQMEPHLEQSPKTLVGSGNGIRKNKALKKLFEESFGCLMEVPMHLEEAAFGAAIYALILNNKQTNPKEFRELITYQ